jgi:hypothetical protein
VGQLKKNGVIDEALAGLTYKQWENKVSGMLNMGYFNFNSIVDGKNGVHYFKNLGVNLWALVVG